MIQFIVSFLNLWLFSKLNFSVRHFFSLDIVKCDMSRRMDMIRVAAMMSMMLVPVNCDDGGASILSATADLIAEPTILMDEMAMMLVTTSRPKTMVIMNPTHIQIKVKSYNKKKSI